MTGQSKLIKISGRVNDASNGSPLLGASVLIENTKAGVKTDVEGNFFISLEEGKTYNLLISNVGYQTKLISGIQPSRVENQPINVSLEQGTGHTGECSYPE